jgi:hypothetical protein
MYSCKMKPLSLNDVESELSYAYLHAVASAAAASCSWTGRHEDNAGVDAKIVGWGPFPNGGYRQEVDLKVQLKATAATPAIFSGCLSYNLKGVSRYNDLRSDAVSTPRILVVLFLPGTSECDWITHTNDALSLHKCAYWASLRGAPESPNKSGQTIYLPQSQRFDVGGLRNLFSMISRQEAPHYQPPPI